MTTTNLKKMLAGTILSGVIALTAGLTAATASASPSPQPELRFEQSDSAVPGDGSVRAGGPQSRVCDGSVRVAGPIPQACDGSVRVAIPAP